MKLTACFQKGKTKWTAFLKEIPGVVTEGKTKKQARENLKDALISLFSANVCQFEQEYKEEKIQTEEFVV